MSGVIDPRDFKNWQYKYVRFADGTVLFCDACDMCSSHKQIADAKPDVPPAFAGQIKVKGKRWCITEGGSTTLKLPRGSSDEKYIERILSPLGYTEDPTLWYS